MACRNGHLGPKNKFGRCVECQRAGSRRYHDRNKERRNAESRDYLPGWRKKNGAKIQSDNAAWRDANKERHVKNAVEWRRRNWKRIYAERLADPQKRLRGSLSSAICIQLRAGGTKKETTVTKLIGCTIPEFMAHIERQWTRGMSWKNWGRKGRCWQLDHRKPVSSFDLTDPIQRAACFHYTNYQPLWMPENLRKSAKDPIAHARAEGRLL
jgi:hypothetical protein